MKRCGHLLKGWTHRFCATRRKGVGLRTVYTLLMGIVVLFTALGIAHSQERLQISFKGKATLSISGNLPSCGDFEGALTSMIIAASCGTFARVSVSERLWFLAAT